MRNGLLSCNVTFDFIRWKLSQFNVDEMVAVMMTQHIMGTEFFPLIESWSLIESIVGTGGQGQEFLTALYVFYHKKFFLNVAR